MPKRRSQPPLTGSGYLPHSSSSSDDEGMSEVSSIESEADSTKMEDRKVANKEKVVVSDELIASQHKTGKKYIGTHKLANGRYKSQIAFQGKTIYLGMERRSCNKIACE